MRDRPQRRLELPVDGVQLVVALAKLGAWLDRVPEPDERPDGIPAAAPGADPSGQGGAEGCSRMVQYRYQRHVEHVREDLLPQQRGAATVGDAGRTERDPAFGEHLDVVAKPVGDRLERRAVQMSALVAQMQADKGTARRSRR